MNNYRNNINGNSQRKKIRIRWYGDFFGEVSSPTLEIKEKKDMVVNKTSIPMPNFLINPSMSVKNIIKDIAGSLYKDALFIRLLNATIINRYKREYFLSQDKRFRITIDTNQSFSNTNNIKKPQKMYTSNIQPAIIEVKYSLQFEKEAHKITNALGLRINKNSKYINSINAGYAYIF